MWLGITKNNPDIRFWAFTKSIQFWVNRLSEIPSNFTLQASRGSLQDDLAIKNSLKYAEVFKNIEDIPKGMRIDYDDTLAMSGSESFALLDNFKYNKKQRDALVK